MGTVTRYSPEVRERAIRMVADHPSQWAAIESVASKLGMTPETLRHWVRRAWGHRAWRTIARCAYQGKAQRPSQAHHQSSSCVSSLGSLVRKVGEDVTSRG